MNRGQAFTSFKLLIAGAFAVALLIIAYGVVSLIQPVATGMEDTKNILLDAKSGIGRCFSIETSFLRGEEFSKSVFQSQDTDQINFIDYPDIIECTTTLCKVEQDATVPVSVKCLDPATCTIYFGSYNC